MRSFILILVAAPGLLAAILDNRIEECSGREEPLGCLGAVATVALDRAARMSDIPLMPGIALVKVKEPSRGGRGLQSPEELEASLPTGQEERSARVLDMLYDAGLRFLQTHSLQIGVPDNAPESLEKAIEEGRAKIKKKVLPILMLVGVKILALLPLALGAIGLIALKALLVGKVAFIIAAIIAFQKFFSGGTGGIPSFGKAPALDWGSSSGGWAAGGAAAGGPYRRSMESHDLAYSAQLPIVDNNSATQ